MSNHNTTISANGAIALWELSGTFDLAIIRAAFQSVGLDHIAPRARTPLACLHAALVTLYARRGVLVRPLGSDGYAVVEDVPNEVEMRMGHRDVQAARVDWRDGTLTIREEDNREEITRLYAAARGQIDHDALSSALRLAVTHLSGTPVRTRGGVYWLPADSADKWRALGAALSASGAGGQAALYTVTTVGDADTVDAIVAAFSREVLAEAEEVHEGLATAGQRAAQNKARRMGELVSLADYYERVLGRSLALVRARIEQVGAAAGAAALDAI